MKAHSTYKSSQVEWLDHIPEHWNEKRVKFVFEIRKRIAGKEGLPVLSITQKGIKVKDIETGTGQLAMDYSDYQLVEVGDFAMNQMDLLTGFVDISSYAGVTSPDYRVFSLIDINCATRFLLYVFQHCYNNKIFFRFGHGSSHLGRWRLPTDEFNDFRLPIPPLPEQKAIADFLDRKTAQIDTLIEKKQGEIELLREMRDVLTQTAMRSPKAKSLKLSEVAEQIKRPINRQDEELYEPIGLYNRGRGIFHKPITKGMDLGDSDFFEIKAGDFVISGQFAWEGAVALAQQEEDGCIASHRYYSLRGKPDCSETAYLFSFFTTQLGDKLLNHHSRGAAGRNRPLNINTLLREKIPVPPLSLQEPITALIEKEVVLKKNTQKLVDLLQEYRTALISEAVTGKIDVRTAV